MRGFLAGDVPGPLRAYVLTWVDWLKTGLNRCKVRLDTLVGGTHDTASSLYIKKLFLVLASYSRAVTLVGCFVFRGPISWWRPDTLSNAGHQGRAGVSKKKEK